MDPYGRRPDPASALEESMWHLGLGRGPALPERPGEPDCAYYMRNGSCGYGERCRFNHPLDRGGVVGAARTGAAEYPERLGQPACQYFLKTRTCKYGSSCKYDHPRQGNGSMQSVSLNYFGYPLRMGEKECSYYMRTGQCKFGSTCKFHHPQPTGGSMASPAPAYYPSVHSTHQYSTMDVTRPSVLATQYIQGPYGPMLVSPGVVPIQSWTPYQAPVSPVMSPGGQHRGSSNRLSPSAPAYQGTYPVVSSTGRPSSSGQKEQMFPERPGQPECQYYMRTGDCKYGSTCKFNHPPERSMPETNCVLSPIGLPLRSGAPPCAFYAQHGMCKFGATCKFDHPMGTLSYSPGASSLADMPVGPYPLGFPMATLTPSSSSSELQLESAFYTRMPSSTEGTSGGSYVPHFLVQLSVPTSATSSSIMGRSNKISTLR